MDCRGKEVRGRVVRGKKVMRERYIEAQDISGSFKSRSFIVKFSSIQLLWKSIKGKLNCN